MGAVHMMLGNYIVGWVRRLLAPQPTKLRHPAHLVRRYGGSSDSPIRQDAGHTPPSAQYAVAVAPTTKQFLPGTVLAEPYAIKMPQLSDTMTEGVIVSW